MLKSNDILYNGAVVSEEFAEDYNKKYCDILVIKNKKSVELFKNNLHRYLINYAEITKKTQDYHNHMKLLINNYGHSDLPEKTQILLRKDLYKKSIQSIIKKYKLFLRSQEILFLNGINQSIDKINAIKYYNTLYVLNSMIYDDYENMGFLYYNNNWTTSTYYLRNLYYSFLLPIINNE